jgi:hypothetical protein
MEKNNNLHKKIVLGAAITASVATYSQDNKQVDTLQDVGHTIELKDMLVNKEKGSDLLEIKSIDSIHSKQEVPEVNNTEVKKVNKNLIKPDEIKEFLIADEQILDLEDNFESFVIERWTGFSWELRSYGDGGSEGIRQLDTLKYRRGWYRILGKVIDSNNNVISKTVYFSKDIKND